MNKIYSFICSSANYSILVVQIVSLTFLQCASAETTDKPAADELINTNHAMVPTASGIDGTINYSETVCPGYTLCFDIFSSASSPDQIVHMQWDGGIQDASFTVSGELNPTGHFCWTPSMTDAQTLPHIFTVTVRNEAGKINAERSYQFSIFVPKLAASVITRDVTCYGNADGSATVFVTGGSGNYSYLWSPNGETLETATGLQAGNYSVNVMDDFGCEVDAWATISEAAPLLVGASATPSAFDDGTATAHVSGGNMPYRYSWSPAGGNDAVATNLEPGIYTVVINDANDCSNYSRIHVTCERIPELNSNNSSAPLETDPGAFTDRIDEESGKNAMLRVYPNPCTDKLFIKNDASEKITISIFNSVGEGIYSTIHILPHMQVSIPFEELSAGIYLIKSQHGNEVEMVSVVKE